MNRCKRILAVALALCLTLTLLPTAAFAEVVDSGDPLLGTGSSCEHHWEHTPDCGWVDTEPETSCGFDSASCPDCYPTDSGTEIDTDSGEIVTITAFGELADEIHWQRTLTPTLPETLTATADDGQAEVPVTWSAEGFDPDKPADGKRFTLLPTLGEGYAVAEGVRLPQITLVTPPMGRMVGEGTKNNPLQITSAEQLGEIRDQVNAGMLEKLTFGTATVPVYLELATDIDLGGEGWEPIGIYDKPFKSHFDGGGHKITGLKIDSSGSNGQGLFGWVKGGTVENLAVLGVDITVSGAVGGVVGYLDGGTVKNCYTSGSVVGSGDSIGGVVGRVENSGTVANCYSTALVSGHDATGGVVGWLTSGKVENCAALNPKVTGSGSDVGRVVGLSRGGTIENCYAFAGMTGSFGTTSGTGDKNGADLVLGGDTLDRLFTGGKWVNAPGKLPGFGEAVELPDYMLSATAPFPGDGTEEKPYLISSPAQLRKLATLVNTPATNAAWAGKTYKLTADLDLFGYASGDGWEPIGTIVGPNFYPFQGTFDGDGHKIRGLKINRSSEGSIGLFGFVDGGKVQNLGLVGVNIIGGSAVGSVVGLLSGDTVGNCYVTGSVNGGSPVGGVVGSNSGGTVQNCYSTASVRGSGVGGIVGSTRGNVTNCAALGASVSGSSGSSPIGRVVGNNAGGPLSNNYAFDGMTDKDNNVIGDTDAGTLNGTSITPDQIAAGTILNGLFTGGKWVQAEGKLPGFGAAEELPGYLLSDIAPFPGGGTEDKPYQISTPAQLQKLATLVNNDNTTTPVWADKHYRLMNDISLKDYQTGTGWTPIGSNSNRFKGTFTGGGYQITDLKINTNSDNYIGLFGFVDGGKVQNLALVGANVKGNIGVGGVVGYLDSHSTVENCYVTGSITGTDHYIGGVASIADGAEVNHCYSTASVTGGGHYIGGIVGNLSNGGRVTDCAALGKSGRGNDNVGRVVGNTTTGTSSNNYAFAGMDCTNSGLAYDKGTDISISEALSPDFWKDTANFDPDVWAFTAGKLPVLKGTGTKQLGDSMLYLTAKSLAHSTVTIDGSSHKYTGSAIEPEVAVSFGDTPLTKDTDYTVAYTNNTSAPTATVTVSGIGNYGGTKTATFSIDRIQLTWDAASPGTVNPKTFDGNTTATVLTAPKLSGVVSGDDMTVTCTVEFTDAAVGESIPIKVTGWSLTGPKAGNYIPPVGNPIFTNGKITGAPNRGGGGSSDGGDSSDTGEYDFWMRVKDQVNAANQGDVLKVNAESYDKMPVSVVNALREKGVGMVLSWKGGGDIVIPAGKAQQPEENRVYYPLSLLAERYSGTQLVETPADRLNPTTGGTTYSYLDTTTGKTVPVTGGVSELAPAVTLPETKVIANTPTVITPPDAGFEPDAFAGTPDAQKAKGKSAGAAAGVILLAALAGGVWFWRKKQCGTKQ